MKIENKTFAEWVTHDDGNEAGMTIRDAVGDPAILSWMGSAWNKGRESVVPTGISESQFLIILCSLFPVRHQGSLKEKLAAWESSPEHLIEYMKSYLYEVHADRKSIAEKHGEALGLLLAINSLSENPEINQAWILAEGSSVREGIKEFLTKSKVLNEGLS